MRIAKWQPSCCWFWLLLSGLGPRTYTTHLCKTSSLLILLKSLAMKFSFLGNAIFSRSSNFVYAFKRSSNPSFTFVRIWGLKASVPGVELCDYKRGVSEQLLNS